MSVLTEMGKQAKEAAVVLAVLPTPKKNQALRHAADALLEAQAEILDANAKDVAAAKAAGIKGAFIDRLTLNEKRVWEMAEGLRQVAALEDPVGKVLFMKTLDNGLIVGQKRVPMGVIGQYGLSFPKIRRFADELGHVCDAAMEHGYGLFGLGD